MSAFPTDVVETAIRDELAAAKAATPFQFGGATAQNWEAEIDSMVIVEVLCAVQEAIGIDLSEDIIPQGGFETADECVATVLAAAAKTWDERAPEEAGAKS